MARRAGADIREGGMIPTVEIDRAAIPGSAEPLILLQHGTTFEIRIGPVLLMSSRMHGSEELLAERACVRLADRRKARLLIGGIGMGFTLAVALRHLPATAGVVVAEEVARVRRTKGGGSTRSGWPRDQWN